MGRLLAKHAVPSQEAERFVRAALGRYRGRGTARELFVHPRRVEFLELVAAAMHDYHRARENAECARATSNPQLTTSCSRATSFEVSSKNERCAQQKARGGSCDGTSSIKLSWPASRPTQASSMGTAWRWFGGSVPSTNISMCRGSRTTTLRCTPST